MKAAFYFYSLTNPSPDEKRDIDLGTFKDEEEGDIDDESDVELDGNDQLDVGFEQHDDDLVKSTL